MSRGLEHKWLWVVAVAVVTIPAVWALFRPGYFNMHDDLQMMRQLELEKCFKDAQIPCRWVPDMGYGYGYPLFSYYPQGPYLIGEIFRIMGVSFTWTAKLLFATAIVASAVAMFVLGRSLWGGWGGLVASGFYALAPYHAVDVYVRGAMNETWALVWFPLILWAAMQIIKKGAWRYLVWLVVGWAGLLLSHNLMAMAFAPVFIGWVVVWLVLRRNFRAVKWVMGAGVWALSLVAFFELPVFLERNLVQMGRMTSDYYNFEAHFTTLTQLLISRYWGYGGSIFGTGDTMSFQIGWAHWALSLLVLAGGVWAVVKAKRSGRRVGACVWVGLFLVAVGWGAAFMTHGRSVFAWKAFGPLAIMQFPWRWLGVAILGFSGAVGAMVWLAGKRGGWLALVLILVAIFLYWGYFQPEKWGPLKDEEKFSGEAWRKQQSASVTDYLPVGVREVPGGPPDGLVEVVEGEAAIEAPLAGTNWASFVSDSEGGALVRLNIFDFPRWRVFVDSNEVEIFHLEEDSLYRLNFRVPAGRHEVRARLFDTPVRQWGNVISLVSLALLVSSWWWRKVSFGK